MNLLKYYFQHEWTFLNISLYILYNEKNKKKMTNDFKKKNKKNLFTLL